MSKRSSIFSPSWAWPPERRDLLLKAALLPEQPEALGALEKWLSQHNLDELNFADHRLLAAITERHGQSLSHLPEYPRLKGLQRQLWTQSRIRINAAMPMLKELSAAGIELMLLKGAARIATNSDAQRQRSQQDVDILVRDEQIKEAARLLTAFKWQTKRGDSALTTIARVAISRATNFQLPPWGDIDLHRRPYHGAQNNEMLDQALWVEALPANFFGLDVKVPCAEERLAMMLFHGTRSPESHSDWLLDTADLLSHADLNWEKLADIISRRKMVDRAQIGLTYLQHVLGQTFPTEAGQVLSSLRPERSLTSIATRLLARQDSETPTWIKPLRNASAAYIRNQTKPAKINAIAPRSVSLARRYRGSNDVKEPQSTIYSFTRPAAKSTQNAKADSKRLFTAELLIPHPAQSRRVELELSSSSQILVRFRVLVLGSGNGLMRVRLKAKVPNIDNEDILTLESRSGVLLTASSPPREIAKYRALPFQVISWRVS